MKLFLMIVLLLVCVSSQAAPKKILGNVYNDDARGEVDHSNAPWSAIGKLKNADGSYCTASLIGPDLIVTAAHCVMDDNGNFVQGTYNFISGYKNGLGDASSVTHFWWGTNDPQNNRDHDWAIGRLSTALGNAHGWFGVEKVDGANLVGRGDIYLGGYSSDFRQGEVASQEGKCSFMGYEYGFLLHNCDMSPGASGGPMFTISDSNNPGASNHIVAINVAERRNGASSSLVGVPYSRETANVAVPAADFFDTFIQIRNGN